MLWRHRIHWRPEHIDKTGLITHGKYCHKTYGQDRRVRRRSLTWCWAWIWRQGSSVGRMNRPENSWSNHIPVGLLPYLQNVTATASNQEKQPCTMAIPQSSSTWLSRSRAKIIISLHLLPFTVYLFIFSDQFPISVVFHVPAIPEPAPKSLKMSSLCLNRLQEERYALYSKISCLFVSRSVWTLS